ncbi:MAG: hypothetical protein WAV51_00580 [Microgenomates group bacterium]
MAELAGSRSILFGTSKGFAPVPHMELGNRFPSESSLLLEDINKLAGKTESFHLTTLFSENGPKSAWSGLVLRTKSLSSELRSNAVSYETPDHKLGIAFPKHVEVVKPTGIGGERTQHLEMCGQRITSIIERSELVRLAEAYVSSGKQINEQWLWDTFNTKSASGLHDILHEYGDALKVVMEETWKDLTFGKLPAKPVNTSTAPEHRFTVSKGTPIAGIFQEITAEQAIAPSVRLTTMDKMNVAVVLTIGAAATSGCNPIQTVTPTEVIQIPPANQTPEIPTDVKPTITSTEQSPASTPTNPVAVGPESTPESSVPYPTDLYAETVKSQLTAGEPAVPSDIANNEGVKAIIARHTEWAKQAGLDFDAMQIHMAPDGIHWYLVPEKNGTISGWLMIEDASSQTGWRYAEQPTYDSQFDPSKDTFQFGLPALHNTANHFDTIYAGFPLLVEVSAKGEPQYWNNIAAKEVQEVKGATIEKDYRAEYEKVKADPWTATEAEKAGYDTYVRQQLAAAGIENAETLPDYELLEAVIEYQQHLIETGGLENPADYLVDLPLSLHELIRTDMNNVIGVHYDESRSATYGIGGTARLTREDLLTDVIAYYPKFSVYGKMLQVNTSEFPINGDLVLLYKTPGMDPSVGIGAVIRMYDGNKVAYTEVLIPTTNAPMNSGDMCLNQSYGEAALPISCPVGAQRAEAYLKDTSWEPFNLSKILKIMSESDQILQLEITSDGMTQVGVPMWSDGVEIANNITILDK